MNRQEILNASSMPLASPSYPKGPYRFNSREYLLVHYESDPDVIRELLPEPLEPDGNHVFFEWMKMPDSSGFGDYQESGCGIAAKYEGVSCNYSVMMYLDDEPPTSGGREIWGFPKKFGIPRLKVVHDTLTGTLHYDSEMVAMGTMSYKHERMDPLETASALSGKLNINLKWIPDVDGGPKVVQLVGYHLEDVQVKFSYKGPARLHLVPHVNCRLADLPVRKILFGQHILADLTLPFGEVLLDYLA